jgi:hypothetical protein
MGEKSLPDEKIRQSVTNPLLDRLRLRVVSKKSDEVEPSELS